MNRSTLLVLGGVAVLVVALVFILLLLDFGDAEPNGLQNRDPSAAAPEGGRSVGTTQVTADPPKGAPVRAVSTAPAKSAPPQTSPSDDRDVRLRFLHGVSNEPIANTAVEINWKAEQTDEGGLVGWRYPVRPPKSKVVRAPAVKRRGYTARDGTVTIRAPGFATARLRLRSLNHVRASLNLSRIWSKKPTPVTAPLINIWLEPRASITGILRRPDLSGAPGVDIYLTATWDERNVLYSHVGRPLEGPPRKPDYSLTTDEGGRFAFDDLPAGIKLHPSFVRDGKQVGGEQRLTLAPGEARTVEWVLLQYGSIAGRVTDQHGAGLAAVVIAYPVETYAVRGAAGRPRSAGGELTDAEGRFLIQRIGVGSYHLLATTKELDHPEPAAPGTATVRLTATAPDAQCDIKVERGRYVEGIVVDPMQRPVQHASVSVVPRDVLSSFFADQSESTGADGRFRVGPFAPGDYLIRAESARGFAGTAPKLVRAGDQDLRLELLPPHRITGTVLTADGKPAFCEIELRTRRFDAYVDGTHSEADDGSFAFEDIGPLEYDLVITDEEWVGPRVPVNVKAGAAPRPIDVRVDPAGRLAVAITPHPGTPAGDAAAAAKISVVRDRKTIRTRTTPERSTRFKVPAGPLVVHFDRAGEHIEKPITVRRAETTNVKFP